MIAFIDLVRILSRLIKPLNLTIETLIYPQPQTSAFSKLISNRLAIVTISVIY